MSALEANLVSPKNQVGAYPVDVHTTEYAVRNPRPVIANSQSSLPQPFLDRMAHLLGDEYAAFLASYAAPRGVGLRVNTLKLTPDRFRALAPFDLTPVAWSPGAYLAPEDAQPGKHPYHAAGLYYLQDPSAMIPAALLDPQPGERVLDLAAAPGGKATHITALMGDEGLLVANEIHPKRVWALAENLERWGVRNAVITNETPKRLAERFAGFFDRVLLDAPCSGEGMMRKTEVARVEWAPELVHGCALRQSTILSDAACLVRPGGRLVYSTCTFAPEENEGTLARFLRDHPDFEPIEPVRRPGFGPGRPDWLPDSERVPGLARAVRLWPHTGPGEGHFVAVLERRLDVERSHVERFGWRCEPLSRPLLELYAGFCRETLTAVPAEARLTVVGSYLYALPDGLPASSPDPSTSSGHGLGGLHFIHPGWWLGTFKKNRFEPSHALALSLRIRDVQRVLDLPSDGAGVRAYLRGETLSSTGEDGWVLITVDGFPLGWGKRVNGRVKSHYPRGLRWF